MQLAELLVEELRIKKKKKKIDWWSWTRTRMGHHVQMRKIGNPDIKIVSCFSAFASRLLATKQHHLGQQCLLPKSLALLKLSHCSIFTFVSFSLIVTGFVFTCFLCSDWCHDQDAGALLTVYHCFSCKTNR